MTVLNISAISKIVILFLGVMPAFMDAMKIYRPQEHKVVYQILVNLYRITTGLEYLERNTCLLDTTRMDIEIGEHCKTNNLLLFSDQNPTNLNLIPIILEGGPLQKLTGEFMTKCYGVVLPSAVVTKLKGNLSIKYKSECERTTLGRYMLVEKGPIGHFL